MNQLLEVASSRDIAEPSTYITAILLSFVCSLIIYELYKFGYLRSNVGSGINRFFVIGGPSITALLIAIQFSLPLSLGLLGALSIVRFRTPVKDPHEIAYVLALISISVGCATLNYIIVIVMTALIATITTFGAVFSLQRLTGGFSYHFSISLSDDIDASQIRQIFREHFTNSELANFRKNDKNFSVLARSSQKNFETIDTITSKLQALPGVEAVSHNTYQEG